MDKLPDRKYDLEERTLRFAKDVIAFVRALPKDVPNIEISKQLVRAAGSVGANYIEANEALGTKDFLMKIRISRREAKESRYWLHLADGDEQSRAVQTRLINESMELTKIFSAILRNSQKMTLRR
jgi:four helix bundle protein